MTKYVTDRTDNVNPNPLDVEVGGNHYNISKYQPEKVLAGNDGWNPIQNGNALLTNIKR